jgi:hypothetical protein
MYLAGSTFGDAEGAWHLGARERCGFNGIDACQWWGLRAHTVGKIVKRSGRPPGLYEYAFAVVADLSGDPALCGQAPHIRPKSDPLNHPAHADLPTGTSRWRELFHVRICFTCS